MTAALGCRIVLCTTPGWSSSSAESPMMWEPPKNVNCSAAACSQHGAFTALRCSQTLSYVIAAASATATLSSVLASSMTATSTGIWLAAE